MTGSHGQVKISFQVSRRWFEFPEQAVHRKIMRITCLDAAVLQAAAQNGLDPTKPLLCLD